jgi:hypothetical protein
MNRSSCRWNDDVVMGTLLSGAVAPVILALPADWRGPSALWVVLALSVGAVTGARRLWTRRVKTRQ